MQPFTEIGDVSMCVKYFLAGLKTTNITQFLFQLQYEIHHCIAYRHVECLSNVLFLYKAKEYKFEVKRLSLVPSKISWNYVVHIITCFVFLSFVTCMYHKDLESNKGQYKHYFIFIFERSQHSCVCSWCCAQLRVLWHVYIVFKGALFVELKWGHSLNCNEYQIKL